MKPTPYTGWLANLTRDQMRSITRKEPATIGMQCACKHCGHDIEWHGRNAGWVDRGNGRTCLPYTDPKTREIVRPTTKHTRGD